MRRVETEPERAALLLGAAEAQLEATGARLEPAERAVHDGAPATVREAGDAELVERAWSAGRALSFDSALALGFATCDALAARQRLTRPSSASGSGIGWPMWKPWA